MADEFVVKGYGRRCTEGVFKPQTFKGRRGMFEYFGDKQGAMSVIKIRLKNNLSVFQDADAEDPNCFGITGTFVDADDVRRFVTGDFIVVKDNGTSTPIDVTSEDLSYIESVFTVRDDPEYLKKVYGEDYVSE